MTSNPKMSGAFAQNKDAGRVAASPAGPVTERIPKKRRAPGAASTNTVSSAVGRPSTIGTHRAETPAKRQRSESENSRRRELLERALPFCQVFETLRTKIRRPRKYGTCVEGECAKSFVRG